MAWQGDNVKVTWQPDIIEPALSISGSRLSRLPEPHGGSPAHPMEGVFVAKEVLWRHDTALEEAQVLNCSGGLTCLGADSCLPGYEGHEEGNGRDYWHASWKHGDENHSLYLECCRKVTAE